MKPTACLPFVLGLGAALGAQDPILIVEAPRDRVARNLLESRLAKVRVDLKLADEGPKEIAERLNLYARDVTDFLVRPHDGDSDYASLKLNLKRTTIRNCMSIVQSMSDVRFVYKAGVVMLTHKDDVKEVTTLVLYDVRAATFKLKDFPGPKIGQRIGEEEDEVEEETDSDNTPSGLTLEKLEEVIRAQILPESWGGENGASISAANGVLIVRQSERGHREIRQLLYQLGVGPNPRPLLRRRVPVVPRRARKKPSAPKAGKKKGA